MTVELLSSMGLNDRSCNVIEGLNGGTKEK